MVWFVGFYGISILVGLFYAKDIFVLFILDGYSIFFKHFVSIYPIDGTLTGTTTPGQSGPGSNGGEWVLHILQTSRNGTSPSDRV